MSNVLVKAYDLLIKGGELLQSPLLLVCRLYWGWQFMHAGLGKFEDIGSFIGFLESLNYPAPILSAYAAALTETLGGFFLIIGLGSRLVAIPLIVTMFTAYALAHEGGIYALFTNPKLFVEQSPFVFLLVSFFVLAFGPGVFSVDAVLKKWVFKTTK